ncbi:hypothetical protein ACFX1R_007895 [Malus domestica]
MIMASEWCWPFTTNPAFRSIQSDSQSIVPSSQSLDSSLWAPSNTGIFSLASIWNCILSVAPKIPWDHLVWHNASIPRASFVLWLAIKNKLTTLDRIGQFSSRANLNCVLCDSDLESHSHLFFDCPFTEGLWQHVLMRCGVPWLHPPWPSFVDSVATHWRGKSLPVVVKKLSLAVTVYCIWCERNNRMFNNCRKTSAALLQSITNMIWCRLCTLHVKPSTINMMILHNWNVAAH